MLIDEQPLFDIREYAIGSLYNRNQFNSLDFAQTLQGKRESFQSYFHHTEQISNYAQAQLLSLGKISVTGYKGIVAADCLLIDVDDKDNLALSIGSCTRTYQSICQRVHIPPTSFRIRFSGSKGFHFIIPTELFGGFIPSATLPALHSALAGALCKGYEEHIDLSIYHTVSLIRIENAQNAKSNLFCIPLTFEELQSMYIDDIKKLAEQPRYHTIPNTNYIALDSLIQLTQTCLQPVNNVVIENKKPLKSSAVPIITVTPPNVEKIKTMFKYCSALHSIEQKSLNQELITDEDRVALGTVLTAFGDEGKTRVHKLLESQENYNKTNPVLS